MFILLLFFSPLFFNVRILACFSLYAQKHQFTDLFFGGLGVSIQDHVGIAFSQLFKHRIKSLIDSTETHKTWLLLLHIHLSSGVTFVLQTTLFNRGLSRHLAKFIALGDVLRFVHSTSILFLI